MDDPSRPLPALRAAYRAFRSALPRRWHLAVAAMVLAELVVRGPVRALGTSRDLTVHLGAARVFVAGGDPWDMAQVGDAFEAAGGPRPLRPTAATMPSVYPPVTLAVEAPFALFRWSALRVVFALGSLALVLLALRALVRRAGLLGGRAAVVVLGALALAPLHTGLGTGQVAIPSAALLVLGWCWRDERPAWAGVLLGLGAALKPPLAIPFAVACAMRPALPLVLAGGVTFGALLAAGLGRLALAGQDGIGGWIAAVRAAAGPSGMNAATPASEASVSMLHLDLLVAAVTPSPAAAAAVTLLATLPVAALAALRLRATRDRRVELVALGALCAASLLAMYHRTYDAVLLAIPLAGAVALAGRLSLRLRLGLALCLAAFLLPGAPLLDVLVRAGAIPAAVAGSGAWRLLVAPHQIWALLALEGLLAAALVRLRDAPVAVRAGPPQPAL